MASLIDGAMMRLEQRSCIARIAGTSYEQPCNLIGKLRFRLASRGHTAHSLCRSYGHYFTIPDAHHAHVRGRALAHLPQLAGSRPLTTGEVSEAFSSRIAPLKASARPGVVFFNTTMASARASLIASISSFLQRVGDGEKNKNEIIANTSLVLFTFSLSFCQKRGEVPKIIFYLSSSAIFALRGPRRFS